MQDSHHPCREGNIEVRIPFAEERSFGKQRWTEYAITLSIDDKKYTLFRRYSEFYELHRHLQNTLSLRMSFPGKTLYGNLSPTFVDNRRRGLETYLRSILELQHCRDSPDVQAFLDCQQGKYLPCSVVGFPSCNSSFQVERLISG
eukprot:TRINITY_DN508_c0_g1_i1.p1 TRINITY_DN508_c0_g1~~TRINITY_DN508_c0_g1_i1.p1  ORF type:complete len:145 (+),score=12.09 TRINITY_DN508_c0_g1_i1:115-549(+)